jgi:hypothetical protein
VVLRQATALGRFEPGRAMSLGVIEAAELADAEAAFAGAPRSPQEVSTT